MLQYLSGDSLPDFKLDTNQVTRHTHNPKLLHDNIIKHIYQYLMGTIYKRLTFKANNILNMDFYVDKNFTGLWHVQNHEESIIVKQCARYFITLSVCPMLWNSKIQKKMALSITERKYLSISYSMSHILPLKSIFEEVLTHMDKQFKV